MEYRSLISTAGPYLQYFISGLHIEQHATYGWTITTLTAETATWLAQQPGMEDITASRKALLQIKTIVAILLLEYRLTLYGDPLADDFGSLVIGPKMPCRVNYERRERPA